MGVVIKTLKAGQLPSGWQRELGAGAEQSVRVAMETIEPSRSPADVERLLAELAAIQPLAIVGGITDFIRSERARLDGRGEGSG